MSISRSRSCRRSKSTAICNGHVKIEELKTRSWQPSGGLIGAVTHLCDTIELVEEGHLMNEKGEGKNHSTERDDGAMGSLQVRAMGSSEALILPIAHGSCVQLQ